MGPSLPVPGCIRVLTGGREANNCQYDLDLNIEMQPGSTPGPAGLPPGLCEGPGSPLLTSRLRRDPAQARIQGWAVRVAYDMQ